MNDTKKRLKIVSIIFGVIWLISFIGGCTARSLHTIYGYPNWLDGLVGVFIGLVCCSLSLMVITNVFAQSWYPEANRKKIKVLVALGYCIPIFLLGIFVLWRALIQLVSEF